MAWRLYSVYRSSRSLLQKSEGVDELVRHALHIAKYQERPTRQDFCDENDYDGAVHRCIHAVIHLIEDHARRAKLPGYVLQQAKPSKETL